MAQKGRAGRRVTSVDIAREVGLSRTTVSYVLNDTPHQKIPEATRARVLEAAARLGYTPSAAARTLRKGRSDVVLCLLPNWPIGPELGLLLENLSAEFANAGLTFLTHPPTHSLRPAAEIWSAILPAAVLGLEGFTDEEVAGMENAGIAITTALLDTESEGHGVLAQQRVGRMQVEHLAVTGHRRIGYAYPQDPRLAGFAEPRLDGARQACADLGLDEPAVRTLPMEPVTALDAIRSWRSSVPPVTGICAYNDDVAFALLAAMRLLGLSAPDDFAVIGVDDIPTAAFAVPPLTSVVTDQKVVARHIAQTVIRALDGKPPPPRPGSDIISVVRRESA